MTYKELQRKLQVQKLRYKYSEIFNQDKGGGRFDKYKSLSFVLLNGLNNLYPEIQSNVVLYFENNEIAWWGDNDKYPTGHLLSSQIQCLNFLFALKNDKQAILALIQLFDSEIDDVLQTISDVEHGYIAFEFVYENEALLRENDNGAKRGSKCTSIDAFIIALKKGNKILIPIEWKYTEQYLSGEDKALEYIKGKIRQARYNNLIENSKQLKSFEHIENSVYYYEPFYEFMRQTLLVEQMVKTGIANDYLHILIAPLENFELLESNYKCSSDSMEITWRNCLNNQSRFRIVDSKEILRLIEKLPNYSKLDLYLKQRYF